MGTFCSVGLPTVRSGSSKRFPGVSTPFSRQTLELGQASHLSPAGRASTLRQKRTRRLKT